MVRRKEVCSSYSRTHYYKKVTKPLLERKRRVRINRCLEELKEYVVGALMAGFTQCAEEAYNMILNSPEVDSQIGQQLVDHLQTIVGPLSIQVPNFRLVFSSDDGERCRKAECCGGGLLMVADGRSRVAQHPDMDGMWRPW